MNIMLTSYVQSGISFSHIQSSWEEKLYLEFDSHNVYEIYFLIEGNVVFFIEGHQYIVRPGDIILINRNEVHHPLVSQCAIYDRAYIHFSEEYLQPFNNPELNLLSAFNYLSKGSGNLLHSDQASLIEVLSKLAKLEMMVKQNLHDQIKLLLCDILFRLNLSYIERQFMPKFNILKKDKKINDIIDYIDKHFEDDLTLSFLEKNFFITRYYLCHAFKFQTGFSPINYINFRRVTKAKFLISKRMPLAEVCYSVGFKNYSSFYKIFKSITGVSPSNYC